MRHALRRARHDPRQLSLFDLIEPNAPVPTRVSMRKRCLVVINHAPNWLSATEISYDSGLTYRQTIDAINALHNFGLIERQGRKFTARWGSLMLATQCKTPSTRAIAHLEAFFRAAQA